MIRELGVVQAKEVEYCSVEVVYVDSILDCRVAEVVSGTIGHATLHTSTREKDGKAEGIMVATVGKLGGNCPATPTHARVMRTEKGGGRMVPREPLTGMARIPQHFTFRWETS